MTFDPSRWQQDAQDAFDFIDEMYKQAGAMFVDAGRHFEDAGTKVYASGEHGGLAYGADVTTNNAAYIYFKVIVATGIPLVPPSPEGRTTVAFFAIDFTRDTDRIKGPYALFGAATLSEGAKLNHWAMLSAAGNETEYDSFSITKGTLCEARPNVDGRKRFKGIEAVRYFELPLARFTSAATLKSAVDAAIALARDDQKPGELLLALGKDS